MCTFQGGTFLGRLYDQHFGCVTVFGLSPPAAAGGAWTETVIYRFKGGSDAANPQAGLIASQNGARERHACKI